LKNLFLIFLSLLLSGYCVLPVSALPPPEYQSVSLYNVGDLVDWIQNVNLDYLYNGLYKNGVTSLREKGKLLVPSYMGELLHYTYMDGSIIKNPEITVHMDKYISLDSKNTQIDYTFRFENNYYFSIDITEINPEKSYLIDEGLFSYFGFSNDDERVDETMIELYGHEMVQCLVINYPSSRNVKFLKDGFEVEISQWEPLLDIDCLKDFKFDIVPFTYDDGDSNYKDIWAVNRAIEGTLGNLDSMQQDYVNTQAEAKEKVETIINKLYLYGEPLEVYNANLEIVDETFTEAIAGTVGNPAGTDGSYTFKVIISKGAYQKTTKELTLKIQAIGYDILNINISEDIDYIDVNIKRKLPDDEVLIIIAFYDDKKLLYIYTEMVAEDYISRYLHIPIEANTIKVMMWDGLPTMQPLCPAKTITKNAISGEWYQDFG